MNTWSIQKTTPKPGPCCASIPAMFLQRLEGLHSATMLGFRSPAGWQTLTYEEVANAVRRLACGLHQLGLKRGDFVGLLSENRPEWVMADLAIMSLGCVSVPIYPTESPSTVRKILAETQARALIYSGVEQQVRLEAIHQHAPKLKFLLQLDPSPEPQANLPLPCHRLAEVIEAAGKLADHDHFFAEIEKIQPDALATVIFTSGTSGEQKGVMLSHANILHNLEAGASVIPLQSGDRFLSFLPLSHSFERTCGLYGPIFVGAEIFYAPSIDEIPQSLREVRPTIMVAVPRSNEKLVQRIQHNVKRQLAILRFLFQRSLNAARKKRLRSEGENVQTSLSDSFYNWLGEKFFFPRIHRQMGGRLRLMIVGGAALPYNVAAFLSDVGFTVLPGYGLTEAAPVVAVNPPQRNKLKSVGPPLPGIEVKLAADGELLVRGPNVMRGYYNYPADSPLVVDSEGWLHTGDLCSIDDEGYLTILGRSKEMMVTSGGKNVSPLPLEQALLENPLVQQVCMLGDNRKFVACLIVVEANQLRPLLETDPDPNQALQVCLEQAAIRDAFQQLVDRVNEKFPPFSQIKKFLLLAKPFSIEEGTLTPTLKVKRHAVEKLYQKLIHELYGE